MNNHTPPSLTPFQTRCHQIVTDPHLSPKQKANYLALEAENNLPYPTLSAASQQALEQRVICDMYEGHAPYKPRYVLPDYARFLKQGSPWLELQPANDFDDALNMLMIIYHHVPSVTGLPVYLGCLDNLLLPYIGNLTEEQLYRKLRHFWIMLDRTLPDAFMHANVGPTDNIICRLILRIDAELKQVAPNLTFFWDPQQTPENLLLQAITNICECSKPHIANMPLQQLSFDQQGYGVVSCYNSLPLSGGGSTLSRINLKEVALLSQDSDDFFNNKLPEYCHHQIELISARLKFLYEESNFFKESFLVTEGLIDPNRFVAMFGIYAMAEAVNILQDKAKLPGRYGQDQQATELGIRISKQLGEFVESTPVKYSWRNRSMLHAQSGISSDKGTTPGARLTYGEEPDPVSHIMTIAGHHPYYASGISDILTIDETIKQNPQALMQLCKGAFNAGLREFTANVAGNDLVRITGYMVRLSDIARYKEQGSRTNTTGLGSEAADVTDVMKRQPRVISNEQFMRYSK